MSDRLKKLVEEQNKLWTRMQDIQRAAEEDGRDWTAEERTNWDAANERLDVVSGDIERLERSAKREAADYFRDNPQGAPGTEVETPEQSRETRAAEYESAFSTYLRGGMERCSMEQRSLLAQNLVNDPEFRAQGVGTGSAGGYLVPPGYRQVLVETMKAFGGLYNLANVITTDTGNPLQWPTTDTTAQVGSILAEQSAMGTTPDILFGTRTLGAYTYTSNVLLVSLQLLQDSVFDLETFVPRKLGERIGRATAAHFITGTGTGQPTGLLTGITVGKTTVAGQGTAILYDDLIDLEHSIDPAYRNGNTRYLMNDATLKIIRKLKDSQLRPLWVPVPTPGFPATINGIPYTIDQGMPVPTLNTVVIAYGNFNAGYIIRQVHDVQMVRLAERYAEYLQVGFFGFSRIDARPDDPAAVAALKYNTT